MIAVGKGMDNIKFGCFQILTRKNAHALSMGF